MDNEAKLIQKWVDDRFGVGNIFNTQLLLDFLKFAQEELGYRKIEGEPPLLNRDSITKAILGKYPGLGSEMDIDYDACFEVAIAQRDLMIKWYKGE